MYTHNAAAYNLTDVFKYGNVGHLGVFFHKVCKDTRHATVGNKIWDNSGYAISQLRDGTLKNFLVGKRDN